MLETADTPYQQRDLYQTYDITKYLRSGANAVGIWLGNGYGQNFSPYGFRWLGPLLLCAAAACSAVRRENFIN